MIMQDRIIGSYTGLSIRIYIRNPRRQFFVCFFIWSCMITSGKNLLLILMSDFLTWAAIWFFFSLIIKKDFSFRDQCKRNKISILYIKSILSSLKNILIHTIYLKEWESVPLAIAISTQRTSGNMWRLMLYEWWNILYMFI